MNTLKSRNIQRNADSHGSSAHVWMIGRVLFFIVLIALLSAHVMTFAKTVQLSDEIARMESSTQSLQKENAQLKQKMYAQNSITHLQGLATQLGFTKEAEPVFLDSSEFALVP